jgi:CRISPR-associated protein Cas1
LDGRNRRPSTNAGNAFISYVNSIVYARVLTAMRCTSLHPALGFLHADTDRRRNTLALDLAEPFKPLLAERLLRRATGSWGLVLAGWVAWARCWVPERPARAVDRRGGLRSR